MADIKLPSGFGNQGKRVRAPRILPAGVNSLPTFEQEVDAVMQELGDLLKSKHHDYGPKNISQSPGGAMNGLRVRLWDKLARLINLTDKDANPNHESLEDTMKDMANYAIIGLLVLRDKWDTYGE